MKNLILILALSLTTIAQSQSRLGYSYSEILTEFKVKYDYTTGFSEELGKYLQFDMGTASLTYYFNNDNYCYTVILLPTTKEDMHAYIEKYNNKFTIISDTEWKMYGNGVTVTIELIYVEDGGYFFLFY